MTKQMVPDQQGWRLTYQTTEGDIAVAYYPADYDLDTIRLEAHFDLNDFYRGISIARKVTTYMDVVQA